MYLSWGPEAVKLNAGSVLDPPGRSAGRGGAAFFIRKQRGERSRQRLTSFVPRSEERCRKPNKRMSHTSREAESCFHRPLALSTPGGEKRTEHEPKFSNGVQDDCQHLQTAWKSSWAGYNGGTSGNHHNPGGEASLSVRSQIRTESQRGEERETWERRSTGR